MALAWLQRTVTRIRYGPDAETEYSPPIHKLSNRIIEDAYLQGARQIRIDPAQSDNANGVKASPIDSADRVRVSYLINEAWKDQLQLPLASHNALLERFKYMAGSEGLIAYKRFNPAYDLSLKVDSIDDLNKSVLLSFC